MPRIRTVGRPENTGAIANALVNERKAVPVGVAASAEPIQAYLETKVSVPWPPPSAPNTPAHQRTEKYKRGWQARPKGETLTISNGVRYARFLEFGTKFMDPRPALTDSKTGAGNGARNLIRRTGKTAADTMGRKPIQRGLQ